MDSDNSRTPALNRRTPRQSRGEQRLAAILAAGGDVIAEKGYDAATMTEIATRACSSIGAVYQYFPNKEALGIALRTRYADEMADRWAALADSAAELSFDALVRQLFGLMLGFFKDHPAYFALLGAPLRYQRSAEAREQLRERFAQLFQAHAPALARDEAMRVATVALQIVKSFAPLYQGAREEERQLLAREFEQALMAYLEKRL